MSNGHEQSGRSSSPPADGVAPLRYRRFTSAEVAKIVDKAIPYYIEQLASIPYYAALRDDRPFWENYVGSRVVAAYELIQSHEAFTLRDAVMAETIDAGKSTRSLK